MGRILGASARRALHDQGLCRYSTIAAHPHHAAELTIGNQWVLPRHTIRATAPCDLTGSPVVSVPFGLSPDGLPISVQLVARRFDEATLLRVASALEASHGMSQRRPPL